MHSVFLRWPILAVFGCAVPALAAVAPAPAPITFVTLDPGHFHAGLVQKSMYPQVNPVAYVYAPDGDDVLEHLKRVSSYNSRAEAPTSWREQVYIGPDYFERLLHDRPGNVVVMSGNNRRKPESIQALVDAGMNVLADKPMIVDRFGFEQLQQAFAQARARGVVVYDIMTERSEITTVLQREFSQLPEVFGHLETGTEEDPAVVMESVHFFYKSVSGAVLKRPGWFFDPRQQGEGMADVGTHLVDLVQWECFPEQALDYHHDVQVLSGRHWLTVLSRDEFAAVTGLKEFPPFVREFVRENRLGVYGNGEINYTLKGIHARVTARWEYRAPEDSGDTHYSLFRGTAATLVIRQGTDQSYKPTLYIEPRAGADAAAFGRTLAAALPKIQAKFPGVELKAAGAAWQVVVPAKYDVGHEAHFAEVAERFLRYIAEGHLPAWEEPNMLAKYYTTTRGLELARQAD